MKTKQQILEEFKKEIDEVSSKYWEKLQATVEPEQPTSTRLEKLGFYDKGGDYWSLDTDNSLCPFHSDQDSGELIVGNSFKTEQDLQRAAKRREIMADLWRNSAPYVYNGTYSIQFNEDYNKFNLMKSVDYQEVGAPYFTETEGLQIIEKHGDDLKLLLL